MLQPCKGYTKARMYRTQSPSTHDERTTKLCACASGESKEYTHRMVAENVSFACVGTPGRREREKGVGRRILKENKNEPESL